MARGVFGLALVAFGLLSLNRYWSAVDFVGQAGSLKPLWRTPIFSQCQHMLTVMCTFDVYYIGGKDNTCIIGTYTIIYIYIYTYIYIVTSILMYTIIYIVHTFTYAIL